MVQAGDAPVALDRVLVGLLAGQLVQHGHRRRRHLRLLQRVDRLGPLGGGQGGQRLQRLGVADAVAAQLVGADVGVQPEDGRDQVLGADIGGPGLGGDALGLVDHEP